MAQVDRALLDEILSRQPFSRALGARIVHAETGRVDFRLDLRPDHRQQHGFAHGGVIATLADNALSFAAGTVIGDLVTVEFKLNYLRPGVGEALIARGFVLSHSTRQAVCRADICAISDGDETLVAAAQGTLAARAPA